MRNLSSVLTRLLIVIALIAIVWIVTVNYSFFFSKTVRGELLEVQRVGPEAAVLGGAPVNPAQIFSFAIAVKNEEDGRIFTASSEDRQWAAARPGRCVVARIFPYPPWDLDKGGTYYNARLLEQYDCKPGATSGTTAPNAGAAQGNAQPAPEQGQAVPQGQAAPQAPAAPAATP